MTPASADVLHAWPVDVYQPDRLCAGWLQDGVFMDGTKENIHIYHTDQSPPTHLVRSPCSKSNKLPTYSETLFRWRAACLCGGFIIFVLSRSMHLEWNEMSDSVTEHGLRARESPSKSGNPIQKIQLCVLCHFLTCTPTLGKTRCSAAFYCQLPQRGERGEPPAGGALLLVRRDLGCIDGADVHLLPVLPTLKPRNCGSAPSARVNGEQSNSTLKEGPWCRETISTLKGSFSHSMIPGFKGLSKKNVWGYFTQFMKIQGGRVLEESLEISLVFHHFSEALLLCRGCFWISR